MKLAENAERKGFLPSEMVAIKRAMEPIERAAAKERQRAGVTLPETFGKGRHERETSAKIGSFAGVSGRTVEKIAMPPVPVSPKTTTAQTHSPTPMR